MKKEVLDLLKTMYNIPKIVEMFEKNWNQQFDPNSRESCACLLEECVFGHHINPQHAMAIVEEAKKLVFVTCFDADGTIISREISYRNDKPFELNKPSGLEVNRRLPHTYALACD